MNLNVYIVKVKLLSEHVQMLVSMPSKLSVGELVKRMKVRRGSKMIEEVGEL